MKCSNIEKKDILKRINLEFDENGIVFIMGKSGAGKTTLFRILSGIDDDYNGSVEYIPNSKEESLDFYRKNMLGVIFQDFNLIDTLNVKENILLGAQIAEKSFSEEQYESIVELLDIKDIENRTLNFLSGGEKQRVAIARALLRNDRIIFADEPSGSIDEQNTKRLFDYIKKQSSERLFIIITHDKQLATEYGDRIIEISDGAVVSDKKIRSNTPLELNDNSEKKRWSWKLQYSMKNFLKRRKKYLGISFIATFAMCCIMLILGFVDSARNIYYDMDSSGMENDKYVLYKTDSSNTYTSLSDKDMEFIQSLDNINETVFYYKTWINISYDGCTYTANTQVYKDDDFFDNRFKDIEGNFEPETYNIVIDEELAESVFGGSAEAIGKKVELFSDIGNKYIVTVAGVKNTTSDEESELFISEELSKKVYHDSFAFGVNLLKDNVNEVISLVSTAPYKNDKLIVGRAPEKANEIVISAALVNSIKTVILNDNNLLSNKELLDKNNNDMLKDLIVGLKINVQVSISATSLGEMIITGITEDIEEGMVYLNDSLMNADFINSCNIYLRKTDETSKINFEKAIESKEIKYNKWSAGKGLSIFVRVSVIADLLAVVAVIISVFSAIVLHFFVKETVKERKYETGVLRSLGCTRKELFMLLLNEEIILGAVICIFTSIIFVLLNIFSVFDKLNMSGVNIYSFKAVHLLAIVGVTILLFVVFSIPEIIKAVRSNITVMLNEK